MASSILVQHTQPFEDLIDVQMIIDVSHSPSLQKRLTFPKSFVWKYVNGKLTALGTHF